MEVAVVVLVVLVVVRTKGEETKRSDHHQEVEVAVMVAKSQKD